MTETTRMLRDAVAKVAREIADEAKGELVRELIEQNREAVQLLSPAQVCGILDMNPTTLNKTDMPRVVLSGGKMIRYRLSDVRAFIESNLEA
jgi:predicted DNA-binding transcriptional regulator AlpA